MRFVVCHEISPATISSTRMTPMGRLKDWLHSSSSISTALGLRMIGFAGFKPLLKAEVFEFTDCLKLLPKSSKIRIEQAIHISNKNQINLVMLVGDYDATRGGDSFWLQRPGVAKTQDLFSRMGLQLAADENVYSTGVTVEASKRSDNSNAVDGMLAVTVDQKSIFLNLSTYKMVCLLVAIERQLIGHASRFLMTTNLSIIRVVRTRDLLVRWPSLPAIDSTALADNYLRLRKSLNLDLRKREVLEALTLLSKRQETVLTVFGLAIAFGALCASIWLR